MWEIVIGWRDTLRPFKPTFSWKLRLAKWSMDAESRDKKCLAKNSLPLWKKREEENMKMKQIWTHFETRRIEKEKSVQWKRVTEVILKWRYSKCCDNASNTEKTVIDWNTLQHLQVEKRLTQSERQMKKVKRNRAICKKSLWPRRNWNRYTEYFKHFTQRYLWFIRFSFTHTWKWKGK